MEQASPDVDIRDDNVSLDGSNQAPGIKPSTTSQLTDLVEVDQSSNISPPHTPVILDIQTEEDVISPNDPPTVTDVLSDSDSNNSSPEGGMGVPGGSKLSTNGDSNDVDADISVSECSTVRADIVGDDVVMTLPGCSTDTSPWRIACKSVPKVDKKMSIVAVEQPSHKDQNQESDEDVKVDLLTCNICLSEIDNPKSLPCLHTFCKVCLQRWYKIQEDVLACPTCQEKFSLPPDGIEALKGNFFVTQLKDRKNLKRKLSSPENIFCTACGNGEEASTRCLDCDDFLCKKCEEAHETLRILKTHRVINISALRSGKINIYKIPRHQEQCKKHTGQILYFYCETCEMLICRDCTVIDHCRPEHIYINLDFAIAGQRRTIANLTQDCQKLFQEVQYTVSQYEKHEKQLEIAANESSEAIDNAADHMLAELQAYVETKRKDYKACIWNIIEQRSSSIKEQKGRMQLLSSRLKTALDMGSEITEKGSEYDVASNFNSLKTTFQQLKLSKLPIIGSELSKLSFEVNEGPLFTIQEIGQVKQHFKWQRKCKFGRGSDGSIVISKAWAVAVTKDGKVVVANNISNGGVSVHTQNIPHQIDIILNTSLGLGDNPSGWKSFPRGVAVAENGHLFVTDNTMYVKEYDRNGSYVTQFPAVNPKGKLSNTMTITLDCVAVDWKGNLLVGPYQDKFVSIHKPDGSHIRSIGVAIEPHFIAAVPNGEELVISSHMSNTVHVVNGQGNTLHVLFTNSPPSWRPRGVCCTKDQEVFVANAVKEKDASRIYRFNMAGQFLGCITKDVTVPYGLALSDNDTTLIVGDKKMISIFELK